MPTSKVFYKGELRTLCVHEQSGQSIYTDAPTDNHGLGQAFSPTDLAATSLATCMLTVMGIAAEGRSLSFAEAEAHVTKVMGSAPRRITAIHIDMKIPDPGYTEKERDLLEATALHCPVAKSIHPDIEVKVNFSYTQ